MASTNRTPTGTAQRGIAPRERAASGALPVDEREFPYLTALGPAIARLRGGAAFEQGLDLILRGIHARGMTRA